MGYCINLLLGGIENNLYFVDSYIVLITTPKAILSVTKLNLQEAVGSGQLCANLAPVLINTYHNATVLYVGGLTLLSEEGTTQGDPLAMPMYALGKTPLISQLQASNNVTQVWYADDAAAAGSLQDLQWWNHLATLGPAFGYFASAPKTWLLTKHHLVSEARNIFQGTQVNVTSVGRPYLGSLLGPKLFVEQFVSEKVAEWLEELDHLIEVARIQPHAAFAALTQSFVHKLSFLCQCTENIAHLLCPIEEKNMFFYLFLFSLAKLLPVTQFDSYCPFHPSWDALVYVTQPRCPTLPVLYWVDQTQPYHSLGMEVAHSLSLYERERECVCGCVCGSLILRGFYITFRAAC